MNRTLAVAAAAALTTTALYAAPAQADPSGLMTHAEYVTVTAGDTQANVSANCNCNGSLQSGPYTVTGGWGKILKYPTPVGYATVTFRQKTGQTAWRAWLQKAWCPDGGGCNGGVL